MRPMARIALLLAVGALAAALTTTLLLRSQRSDPGARPIAPPPGESLRAPQPRPAPARADPRQVAGKLKDTALLPGERALADALERSLATGEEPSYRVSLDAPAEDNAAQAVRDEVLEWIGRKMAALGFAEAKGRPSIAWKVKLDGLDGGRYAIRAALRTGGAVQFEGGFELPAAYSADRLDAALGGAFAPPPAVP